MGKSRRRPIKNKPQFVQKVLNIVKRCSLEKSDTEYNEVFGKYRPNKHQIKLCITKLLEELKMSNCSTELNVGMLIFVKLYSGLNECSDRTQFNRKLFQLFVEKVDKEYFDYDLYECFRPFFHSLDKFDVEILAAMLPNMMCNGVSTKICTTVINLVCRHRQLASKILSNHPNCAVLKEKCLSREKERRKLYLDYHSHFTQSVSENDDYVLHRVRLRALTNDNEFFADKYLVNQMPYETCAFITLCRTGLEPAMYFRQLKRMEVDNEIVLKHMAAFIVKECHNCFSSVNLYASKWIEHLLCTAIDSPSLMKYLQDLELYNYTFTNKLSSSVSGSESYFKSDDESDYESDDETDDFDRVDSNSSYSEDSRALFYMQLTEKYCHPALVPLDFDYESYLDYFDDDDDDYDSDVNAHDNADDYDSDVYAHEDEGVAEYDFEDMPCCFFDANDERNFVRNMRPSERHLLFYYRLPN